MIKNFFDNVSSDRVFCVITHCDIEKPEECIIEAKLASIEELGGVKIEK